MIPDYGKIYNLGRRELTGLFDGEVYAQEKVDGSQFSFMKGNDGEMIFKSKRSVLTPGTQAMFEPSIQAVLEVAHLCPVGYVFRGEAMRRPKHNVLAYDRVPTGHIALFDVENGQGERQSSATGFSGEGPGEWAELLGLEAVPIHTFPSLTEDDLEKALGRESFLGGPLEGFVFKSLTRTDPLTGYPLTGKLVSPKFREKMGARVKTQRTDIVAQLSTELRTEARWRKAMQHLEEDGSLAGGMSDMSRLIEEVNRDVLEEEEEWIKQKLFDWAWKKKGLGKGLAIGLADWYREELAVRMLEE